MPQLFPVLLAVTQLVSADITIHIDDRMAEVRATYTFRDLDGPLAFSAFRPDSSLQRLAAFEGRVSGRPMQLSGREALWLVRDEGSASDRRASSTTVAVLTYLVRGELTRIPVFVPDAPASAQRPQLTIRVSNAATDCIGEDLFPRFERRDGGVLVARPGNLPSFVLRDCGFGRIGAGRVADAVVVLLVLGGTAGWLVWRRHASSRDRDESRV